MMYRLTVFFTIALLGNVEASIFGPYTYEVNADLVSVTITDYDTSDTGGLVIIDSIDGRSVTSIGDRAFGLCTGLTSISIGNNITSIGEGAFSGCTGLTSISIGNSVSSIASGAFSGCTGLTSITLPDSLTSIGSFELTSDIRNNIGEVGAFNGCTGLTSITIPDSVTSIGDATFSGCTGLTSITLPDSLTKIGLAVFNDTNLTYYSVSEIKYLFSDSYAFLIDGSGASGTPLIPSDVGGKPVRIIGNGAFSPLVRIDATNSDSVLTSITLPGSVISIGDLAFFSCTGLTSITIPDSVTSIGSAAFAHCAKLTSITIPDSVTSMGESSFLDGFFINNYSIYGDYGIFGGCTGLTSISIGNSITRIGDFAFYDCISLASITIPDSVTSIGSGAFSWCTGLTSITIPDSVTSVGSSAFSGSTNLTSVTLPYNFSYSLPSSAVPIYTFDLIIDGLKDDPEFVGAVAQAMLAAENNSGFATKEELPSVEQAGIDQVLAHPASYNLATSAEVANSRTAGQEDILSNPVAYNLYDEASIMEVNVATPLLSMTNAENQAEIEFAIESSDDLQTWTVDERILRTVEGQGDKYFVRVRAGAPYINPGVLVYAHPTLGDILTNAEGYVLYGFSFNSAGQDPTYIGSSWNFVAATATPEADAGVSATLAGATFGNVSDGPWLTVNGLPVYTYPLDTVPYQANGHGIGDVWFTLNPDGSQKP